MKPLASKLEAYWFAGVPALRLALLRVLVGAFALWYLLPRYAMFVAVGQSDPSLFEPVGVIAVLSGPMPANVFQLLVIANLVACVAFLLGWRHRQTGPAFAAMLIVVLCYRNSWSMIYHSDNVLVMHVMILALAPGGRRALVRRARRRRRGDLPAADPWATDPTRAGGTAGRSRLMRHHGADLLRLWVAKVVGLLGWTWATGEAARGQVAVDGLRKEMLGDGAAPLAFALYESPALVTVMAAGSLALELAAPVAMAHRRVGWLWTLAAFAMHWGIFFVMGIKFRYQLSGLIFASFFPLERVALLAPVALRRLRTPTAAPAGP
ncbi:MAG: hypothetical protein WKF75_08215, partial [Singulisphaera sp.]